jgi:beta-phosphoglucomutase
MIRPVRRAVIRSVLFDFDGVLVDSEEHHWRAFRQTLAAGGISLPRALYDRRYLAFDDRTALAAMLRDAGGPGRESQPSRSRIEALLRRKRAAYLRLIGGRLRVARPAAELVRALRRRVPLAIVSGARRKEILAALRRGGVAREFRVIVTAEDVKRSKPDPEGYLLALRRLDLDSGEGSVAIEDSPGGILAARAAGLRVLGIATSYPPRTLRHAGATRVARGIADLTARSILGPFPPSPQPPGRAR